MEGIIHNSELHVLVRRTSPRVALAKVAATTIRQAEAATSRADTN